MLLQVGTDGSVQFYLATGGTGHFSLSTSASVLTLNTWNRVNVRLKVTTLSIKIDGVERAVTSAMTGTRNPSFTYFFVGSLCYSPQPRYVQGQIADMIIWPNANTRTVAEAETIKSAIEAAGGTVLNYAVLTNYIYTLKRNSILQKAILLYGLQGATANAHRLNWVDLPTLADFIGGVHTHNVRGMKLGGAYGRTYENAAAGNYAITLFSASNIIKMGTQDSGPTPPKFYASIDGVVVKNAVNTTTEWSQTLGSAPMHLIAQRTDASNLDTWADGVRSTLADPAATASTELLLGASRFEGAVVDIQDGTSSLQHFGLWQALTLAQAQVLYAAELKMQVALGRNSLRPTTKNNLSYTPSNAEAYSFFSSYNTALINNGSLTDGPIKSGNSPYDVIVTFATATYINEIAIYKGQFNGAFHMPPSVSIYLGTTTATLLGTFTLSNTSGSNPLETLDVSNNVNFNVTSTTYRFSFGFSGSGFVSVAELIIRG